MLSLSSANRTGSDLDLISIGRGAMVRGRALARENAFLRIEGPERQEGSLTAT
jgi:hypothetical protein